MGPSGIVATLQRTAMPCALLMLLLFLHTALVGANRVFIFLRRFFDDRARFSPASFADIFPAFLPFILTRLTLRKFLRRFIRHEARSPFCLLFIAPCSFARQSIADQNADGVRGRWRIQQRLNFQQFSFRYYYFDPSHARVFIQSSHSSVPFGAMP
jgi:hypothetical protein